MFNLLASCVVVVLVGYALSSLTPVRVMWLILVPSLWIFLYWISVGWSAVQSAEHWVVLSGNVLAWTIGVVVGRYQRRSRHRTIGRPPG